MERQTIEAYPASDLSLTWTSIFIFPTEWKGLLSGRTFYDAVYELTDEVYTDEVLETYESEAEIGEAWIQGSVTKNLDLKIGRQILVWGKSDNIRVTDILNPIE